MAYATTSDVQARMTRTLSSQEITVCGQLLEDVAILIDSFNEDADDSIKTVVSCRAVMRALGDGTQSGVPMGATQGSMSALGYSQSWTIGSGSSGEVYLSKTEKQLLRSGDKIGSRSPVEELIRQEVWI